MPGKGKRCSEEHKRRISEALKGNANGRGNTNMLGKHHSEATKRKISDSVKGKKPWNLGKKTSRLTRFKLSKIKKGFNNPNWKGGVTPEHKRIRNSLTYRQWQQKVNKRDKNTCQKCFGKNKRLHHHHILNFNGYPELRFDPDNGITLCVECHYFFHKLYGRKNNTQGQLEEFLDSLSIDVAN